MPKQCTLAKMSFVGLMFLLVCLLLVTKDISLTGSLEDFGTFIPRKTSTKVQIKAANAPLGNGNQVSTPFNSQFSLKHIYHHNVGDNHKIHRRLDVSLDLIHQYELHNKRFDNQGLPEHIKSQSPWLAELPLKLQPGFTIKRMQERSPNFVEGYLNYIHQDYVNVDKVHLDWVEEEEIVPNVTDKDTIVSLALMASNAYVEVPGTGDWTDVAEPWLNKSGYGWLSDGLRGQVFTNHDDSIVVIAIKGTSAAFVSRMDSETGEVHITESIEDDFAQVEGGADTVANDKINDNLLFSCCCARVSYLWTTVCDCYKSSYTCDQKCLEKELRRGDRYYQATLDLYRNVSSQYPKSTIWITGHSLGGSLAALLARTYGLPAVTFQAPGELLATQRLHLPIPPGLPSNLEHIWHFGNTGDPIFMGVCNGASSTCSLGGYAMESQCHSGKTCVYDTVGDLGWPVSIYNHRIHNVIDNIILHYNETAQCRMPSPCQDCFNWKFVVDDKDNKYKLSSSTPITVTETSSCTSGKCTGTSTTTTTTSAGKHKCKRYNWWGRCVEWDDGSVI